MTSFLGEPTTLPVQDLIHLDGMVQDLKIHYDALLPSGMPTVIKCRYSYKMYLLSFLIQIGGLPFTVERSALALNVFQQLINFNIF